MNPAKVRRMADIDDVIVLRRGIPAYRVSRILADPQNPIDALRAQGKLSTRRRVGAVPQSLPAVNTEADLGALLDEDRGRLGD